ncbi:MAG: antibiotic biosynthesis monooxygenase [Burkholderiales bacterium PBB5]|nr:MAG: antibiotic biosynthesis monooxygenase [Burkholderiales bacterium PBB5]
MYSATFIFDQKRIDAEFQALDALIAQAARDTVGYLGEEARQDPQTGRQCNVYYWADELGLQQLIKHPLHQQAKATYSQWLGGYHVVLSKVLRCYGDEAFSHPTNPLPGPAA